MPFFEMIFQQDFTAGATLTAKNVTISATNNTITITGEDLTEDFAVNDLI